MKKHTLSLALLLFPFFALAQSNGLPCAKSKLTLDLRIDSIDVGHYKLVAHLGFNAGSYVVSPSDTLSMLGPFQLDFADGAPLELTHAMAEFPGYEVLYEPALESDMRVSRSPTVFTQPFKVDAAAEFETSGQVFFVLEPSCVPYAVDFMLTQRDGVLAMEAGEIHTAFRD
jgi:hypothetical protein